MRRSSPWEETLQLLLDGLPPSDLLSIYLQRIHNYLQYTVSIAVKGEEKKKTSP